MKTFKQLFIILSLVALTCTSCEDKYATVDELHPAARSFIALHFDSATIQTVQVGFNEYEVLLSDGTELDFDRKGEWTSIDCQMDTMPSAIVPVPIAQYLLVNDFGTTALREISRDLFKYEVELVNGRDLEFNIDGEFIREDFD